MEAHSVSAQCGCCASRIDTHDTPSESTRWEIIRLTVATLTAGAGFLPLPPGVKLSCFAVAWLLAGGKVAWSAAANLFRGKVFDENFLMTLASLGAFAIGDAAEAAAVMIFYGVGELLQDLAVSRSRRNIVRLMDLRPEFARAECNGTWREVSPETVMPGDTILVNPGERIPLDGIIRKGNSFLDTKALTGEPVPRRATVGGEVLSGSINLNAMLEVEVTQPFANSTVSRILEMVRNAAEKKSQSEKFITRFARIYTPAVTAIAAAVAVFPPLLGFGEFSEWLYKGLCFLIVSCPCALVLSIPLSFFGGIGGAARNGILVKGGNCLEQLGKIGTIVFDKTGTLTQGNFKVTELHPTPGVTRQELLDMALTAEAQSNHPIARSIRDASSRPPSPACEYEELPGLGVAVSTATGKIHAGNAKLMRNLGLVPIDNGAGTVVHIAHNARYLGSLCIADTLKPGVFTALQALRKLGATHQYMLTGDNQKSAQIIAEKLHLDGFRSELLPQDKVTALEELMQNESAKTAFVGDGINDAPVLIRADVGIAMGGVGSDAAIEAADVVLMNDDPGKLADAIRIARKTRTIVVENIVLALGFKAVIMLLALIGFASVWLAIVADVGVALLALANALRALSCRGSSSMSAAEPGDQSGSPTDSGKNQHCEPLMHTSEINGSAPTA